MGIPQVKHLYAVEMSCISGKVKFRKSTQEHELQSSQYKRMLIHLLLFFFADNIFFFPLLFFLAV